MQDDLSRFCCQNQECSDYGKRGVGNLTVCAGRQSTGACFRLELPTA